MSAPELVAEAVDALRHAHRSLLEPTPRGVDCARSAFAIAVDRLNAFRALLHGSPESGRGMLPAIASLRAEFEIVRLLLERAAWHQSNLLQRMLQASRVCQAYGEQASPGRSLQLTA